MTTVTGPKAAPVGTTAVSEVAVAELTFAFTPPKKTRLEAAFTLKPEPVIVIASPGTAELDETPEIEICPKTD